MLAGAAISGLRAGIRFPLASAGFLDPLDPRPPNQAPSEPVRAGKGLHVAQGRTHDGGDCRRHHGPFGCRRESSAPTFTAGSAGIGDPYLGPTPPTAADPGAPATWIRKKNELIVTPSAGLPAGKRFYTRVEYDGAPIANTDFVDGFVRTDDGAVVMGEPHVAATCQPTGSTGQWWAATGTSTDPAHPEQPEHWSVDLSRYAGRQVQISISYASDEFVQGTGVFIDNVGVFIGDEVVPTGDGTTSFEHEEWNGWTAAGAPAGSAANENTWTIGTPDDLPHPGTIAQATFAHQPEFLRFLSANFGPYPFTTAGGIMDAKLGLDSSLETQTRPIYAREHFSSPAAATIDVVHELSHQWFGDSLTIARWRDIWLNEGFATYAEWLSSEHENPDSSLQAAAEQYCATPADDPFWQLKIADPGPDHLFDDAIYYRGALTLQQLQTMIGNDKFHDLLRTWTRDNAGGLVTTQQFIDLAKKQNPGRDLDTFFNTWLFTTRKPTCRG